MRFSRFGLLLSLLFLGLPLRAQQTSPTAQAATLLQQSLAAQTGSAAITDITLTGTATFLNSKQNASSTVTVTLTGLSGGATQAVFNMPTGTVTKVWSVSGTSGGAPIVTGNGPNGSSKAPAGSSVTMPSFAWFSPAVLTSLVSGSGYSISYVGSETRNGANVQHVTVLPAPAEGSQTPTWIAQQLMQDDLYLDQTSALPFSISFKVRPSIPPGSRQPLSNHSHPATEEVRYSGYQSVQGRVVPLRIQVFLGEAQTQIMDITISSVAINTGAAIAAANVAGN